MLFRSGGNITIALPSQTRKATITIIDISGKTILRNTYNTPVINLDLDVASGVYFVRVTDETTHERVVKKIVIAR